MHAILHLVFRRTTETLRIVAVLVATGAIASLFEISKPRDAIVAERSRLQETLGQGVSAAILGGFRSLVADAFWLRLNAAWERQEVEHCRRLIGWVTTVDPRPLYFWLNGARMIAYDMPVWRIGMASDDRTRPASVKAAVIEEQAQRALALLRSALIAHPKSPEIWVEIGTIHLNQRNDLESAIVAVGNAARLPRAPFYVSRVYAQLLRRTGRKREAYDWLTHVYPTLPRTVTGVLPAESAHDGGAAAKPADVHAAMADIVLIRIRELEQELEISRAERFTP